MQTFFSSVVRCRALTLVFSVTATAAVLAASLGLFAGSALHSEFRLSTEIRITGLVAFISGVVLTLTLPRLRLVLRNTRESAIHKARFLAAAEATPDAFFLLDPVLNQEEIIDFRFRYLNEKAFHLFNVPPESLMGGRLCELLPVFTQERLFDQFKSITLSGKTSTSIFPLSDPSISATWVRTSVMRYEFGLAVSIADLTAQKELERSLAQAAHHDALTGLPNRLLLDDRLQQVIERAKRRRENAAVLLLNLDGFQAVNEQYGHAAGDHVLKSVAKTLRASVRSTDSIFRLGGDTFVVVIGDLSSDRYVSDFARKVVIALLAPVAWQQARLDISASLGIAVYPNDGTTPESMLVKADIEMHRMKRAHGIRANVALMAPSASASLSAMLQLN